MVFLINCSNLKVGGGLQVADSICNQMNRFAQHRFCVVLSPNLNYTKERIGNLPNVDVYTYEIPNTFGTIIRGRDEFLDQLVKNHHVNAVLTIFGPSRWCPKVPHFSGFAMPHLVIPESPFFSSQPLFQRIKWKLWCKIRQWSFKRSAKCFWTENPYISARLGKLLVNRQVYTISNYYNQVFDHPENWINNIKLPEFDGVTCLSISTHYPHKNFEILIECVKLLKEKYPEVQVRFVLTFSENEMPVPDDVRDSFVFIGRVEVAECPSLYEQCDIMFMPTLLECFTASYPEAMRMEKPIVTTDLEFARGLCGDAACYYSPVDPKAAVEAIYKVATNKDYAKQLTENGKEQLKTFDNYVQRADKLISILEKISK